MTQLLVLLAIGGLLRAAQNFVAADQLDRPELGGALAFGFVLLSALFAGRLVEHLRVPRITGYLLAGVLAGPYVLGLLTEEMVSALGLVDGTAVCLIALTAGGELNVARIRPLLGIVRSMTLWAVVGTCFALTGVTFALAPWLPWLAALALPARLAVSLLVGVALASQSPAVVMAMLEETRSDGPLSQTVLALVVISDLLVIVLFALASAAANTVMGGAIDPVATALEIAWELFGSMAVGLVIGILMALYLANVREGRALFVLIVCVLVAEVGRRIHLDPLIVMLTVGIFIENVSRIGAAELIHEIEAASLPVYVVFFAVAGAVMRIDMLPALAIPAVALVVARGAGFYFGCRYAGQQRDAPPTVTRYTWVGLLPQAGLALALALILQRAFPGIGRGAALLILSVVGINQLVTPLFLRVALERAGESGRRPSMEFGRPSGAPPVPGNGRALGGPGETGGRA